MTIGVPHSRLVKKRAAEIDAQVSKSPQDVAAVAKAFKTTVQKVVGLTRNVEANTPALFKDTKVREAILNGTQAQSKAIAPVMALDSGELLVARVSDYQAAGTRSFDEVKAEIEREARVAGDMDTEQFRLHRCEFVSEPLADRGFA